MRSILLSLLIPVLMLASNSLQANTQYSDGPYLLEHKKLLQQYDIKDNKLSVSQYTGGLGEVKGFTVSKSDTYKNVEKIAAISDIHGQVDIFKALLRNNGVIDNSLNWSWGKGHLVITGDIFDRGDTVTEALWLVFKLEQQAKAAGGKLHYLLGNHEYMVLRGDERYIHDKYKHTLGVMKMDLKTLFNEYSTLGQWLRSKSTVIKINDYIFMHGGIHQDFLDLNLSLEHANAMFRQTIGQSRKMLKALPLTKVLYGRTGPIWYRGYFKENDLTSQDIDSLLKQLGVKHIVVGHTSQQQVETRFGGKVIAIDTSIKNAVKGELLIIKQNSSAKDTLLRGQMDGKQLTL